MNARWLLVGLAAAVAFAGDRAYDLLPRTAPPPVPAANGAFGSAAAPEAPAVVWAIGDGADGGAAARAVSALIHRGNPARMLYLGDVYERGTAEEFRENYDSVYGPLASRTAPTPGNHDWPAHPEGYDEYWRGQTGAATPPWYAFRIGGWNVISLNSEAPHTADSAQVRWLRATLKRTSGTCTLAFWHRPLESAGSHGDQKDVEPFWQELRGHASLIVNGHDHNMQRLRPRYGITGLIAGAGGHSQYAFDRRDSRLRFGDDSRDGALRLALRPGAANTTFVAVDGTVLDRSSVRCAQRA